MSNLVPKYGKDTLVKIINDGSIYPMWEDKMLELGMHHISGDNNHSGYMEYTYRIVNDGVDEYKDEVLYYILSDEGCHILINEGGLSDKF